MVRTETRIEDWGEYQTVIVKGRHAGKRASRRGKAVLPEEVKKLAEKLMAEVEQELSGAGLGA